MGPMGRPLPRPLSEDGATCGPHGLKKPTKNMEATEKNANHSCGELGGGYPYAVDKKKMMKV